MANWKQQDNTHTPMLAISKEKSALLKGVFIVMMVFLHLFNGNHTVQCYNLLCLGGMPFVKWLTNACRPVDFFLFLSGYGLSSTYELRGLRVGRQLRRLLRLYIHYWVVLSIFLEIGFVIESERFPVSLYCLFVNMTGWHCTYNAEMWFLFPYSMVALASPLLISIIKRLGCIRSVLLTAVIHIATCFFISRYGSLYLFGNMLVYQPILFFHFLYAFTVGVVFYNTPVETVHQYKFDKRMPQWTILLLILLSVVTMATFGNAVMEMFYMPVMVILLCQISYASLFERVLIELGRKSMPIWMIHTWLCYYLFQPEVYSLRYPLVIMGGVILASYLIAIPVMYVARLFVKHLRI